MEVFECRLISHLVLLLWEFEPFLRALAKILSLFSDDLQNRAIYLAGTTLRQKLEALEELID